MIADWFFQCLEKMAEKVPNLGKWLGGDASPYLWI